MNRRIMGWVMLVGWIGYLVGFAAANVGQRPSCEPFDEFTPLRVGLFITISAGLGYLVGRDAQATGKEKYLQKENQ